MGAPSAAAFTGLGIQLVASVLLGLYGGRWLDGKLGTAPWLLVAGAFLGAFAGFYGMYRSLMASQRESKKPARDANGRRGSDR